MTNVPDEAPQPNPPADARLYVPKPDGWEVHIKNGWTKEYCFMQNPGEEYFHLLMHGEIYVQHGHDKYCLNCALRHGMITTDRLNWQHGAKKF